MPIIIDREKAQNAEPFNTADRSPRYVPHFFGREVAKYKEGKDDYEINIRYADKYRYNLDELLSQKINYRDQNSGKLHEIPISAVVKGV